MSTETDLLEEVLARLESLHHKMDQGSIYDRPMSREEAADYLGLHPMTVYEKARNGEIAYYRLGDGKTAPMRFKKADLDLYLEQNKIKALPMIGKGLRRKKRAS